METDRGNQGREASHQFHRAQPHFGGLHLRGYLNQAFNVAKKTGGYMGLNPIPAVAKRRVPRRLPDFLKAEEVPAVLQELSTRWQPLFATAVYAGLRKGELAGLARRMWT